MLEKVVFFGVGFWTLNIVDNWATQHGIKTKCSYQNLCLVASLFTRKYPCSETPPHPKLALTGSIFVTSYNSVRCSFFQPFQIINIRACSYARYYIHVHYYFSSHSATWMVGWWLFCVMECNGLLGVAGVVTSVYVQVQNCKNVSSAIANISNICM